MNHNVGIIARRLQIAGLFSSGAVEDSSEIAKGSARRERQHGGQRRAAGRWVPRKDQTGHEKIVKKR